MQKKTKDKKDKNFSSEHFWAFLDYHHHRNLMVIDSGKGTLQLHFSKPKWQKFKNELMGLSALE